MSYDQTVPATGHSGSQDYNAIRNNFVQIQSSFSVNHEPLASGGVDGYHTEIQFANVLGSDPNIAAPVASLYTKAVSGTPQLFFQNGSSSSNVSQLTGNSSATGNGYTTLPGGILLQWASASTSTGTATISFPLTFPTNVFSATVSTTGGARACGISSLSTSSITVNTAAAGTATIYVIAIGN